MTPGTRSQPQTMAMRVCPYCQVLFAAERLRQDFCGRKCRKAYHEDVGTEGKVAGVTRIKRGVSVVLHFENGPAAERFRSNWHRLIQTALKGRKLKNGRVTLAPVLKESFTFNDLRAKSATDEEDFEEAYNRMAHSDRKTTQQIYIRKPRRSRAGRKVGT